MFSFDLDFGPNDEPIFSSNIKLKKKLALCPEILIKKMSRRD